MKRLIAVAVVGGLLSVGFINEPLSAATPTTVTWKVSSLTVKATKNLSNIASSNSLGRKTWSKSGSCVLSPSNKPTKLIMGSSGACRLTLKIAQSGQYPAQSFTKTILRKGFKVNGFTIRPGANLTGANLANANLQGANLQGANLQGAYLTGATMPDGTIHD